MGRKNRRGHGSPGQAGGAVAMRTETKIAKAKAVSEDFGRYAEVMLEEIPDMSLPVLRDCYKHHGTA